MKIYKMCHVKKQKMRWVTHPTKSKSKLHRVFQQIPKEWLADFHDQQI